MRTKLAYISFLSILLPPLCLGVIAFFSNSGNKPGSKSFRNSIVKGLARLFVLVFRIHLARGKIFFAGVNIFRLYMFLTDLRYICA